MAWSRVMPGRGGYLQEDVKHSSTGRERKGQENTARQHETEHETLKDDERHGAESMCVAHEDKGRPITTWSGPIGEKARRKRINQLQKIRLINYCSQQDNATTRVREINSVYE